MKKAIRGLVFKVGKKQYFEVNMDNLIAQALKISKTKSKRLIADGAVDLYITHED